MPTIALDAADAVELAEILEFLVKRVDTLPDCDPDVYSISDLRADVARLLHLLHTSPTTP